jgi:hypothetical protein
MKWEKEVNKGRDNGRKEERKEDTYIETQNSLKVAQFSAMKTNSSSSNIWPEINRS